MKTVKTVGGSHRLVQKSTSVPATVVDEAGLIDLCLGLLGKCSDFSAAERALIKGVRPGVKSTLVASTKKAILAGADPLGDLFLQVRSSATRRKMGAVYTPDPIISSMLNWAADQAEPVRVIDPGAGSGRYLIAAAARFPRAKLIGVELDPLAALMLRANLKVLGLARRSTIEVKDFRRTGLARVKGSTLFIGNPPYVRHHDISDAWKVWFASSAHSLGIKSSKLAGLHIHFFLRVAQLAKPGDVGAFVTSAEWLDVNYGSTLRQLLTSHLGGVAVHVLDARAKPFDDVATTGAITCFKVGECETAGLKVRSVPTLSALNGLTKGEVIPWSHVKSVNRWSPLFRPARAIPEGYIELGEICRVHRGQVTGSNDVWIAGAHAHHLSERVLVPTITKARDLLSAGDELSSCDPLRRVIDIPTDLDELGQEEKREVERFLRWAKKQGAHQSYIARHRRAWWAVGLKDPAPILSTYMARRTPAFVRNLCGARHINIAHGLYPKEPLSEAALNGLAAWLRGNVVTEDGRTYAGGLTKFEPKELERVWIPTLDTLAQLEASIA